MSDIDDELRARRERLERLLTAADRVTRQRVPERPWWVPYALMGGAATVVLVLMFVTGGGNGTGSASTTVLSTVAPGPTATQPVVITLSPTTVPVVVPSTSVAGTDATSTTTGWTPLPGQPVRWVVYEAGVVTLHGSVPDEATATELFAHYAAAVGVERVVSALVVTPGAPAVSDEVLTAPAAMQFEDGSATLQPPAAQFLDMLTAFLAANPVVTVDIGAYTDDLGADASNTALTQARVASVVAYLEAAGIDPGRLVGIGYGEQFPIASNANEQGRALNRRVEFTLHHLLD